MHLHRYDPIPDPSDGFQLFEVAVAALQPTQMCIGMAEIRSRQLDFSEESHEERRRYLRSKPVPLVRNGAGDLWMVDRHHRLRALLELDSLVTTYGYVIAEVESHDRSDVLRE
ncbi:MAG: chromosome partitioning protein ParB, partial [Synechococcaceae bacterium WB9_4xC_028]|nr:chromosome partitioning protein ParB [Synechococcaceae bacterium WB9_4xC_028]